MKEPQHSLRNHLPIVHPVRPLCRLFRIILMHTPRINPHLKLPLDIPLIKLHMPLTRKQPPGNINTLHLGMVRGTPNMYFCARLKQVGCFGGRGVDHVVEVHLVQADCGLVCAEELFPHWRELEVRV